MKITVFYEQSSDSSLSQAINETLRQCFSSSPNMTLIPISPEKIKPCMGCFGCWLKTPGECVIKNDLISQTNPTFVQSDLIIIVSPIYYGCFSGTMKRLLDRVIPNILPFFRIHKNEVHHQPRYKKLAPQMIIAYGENLPDEEKETFLSLTRANATNLNIADPTVYFCSAEAEIPNLSKQINAYISTLVREEHPNDQ